MESNRTQSPRLVKRERNIRSFLAYEYEHTFLGQHYVEHEKSTESVAGCFEMQNYYSTVFLNTAIIPHSILNVAISMRTNSYQSKNV